MNYQKNKENLSILDIPSFLNTDLYNIRICEHNWKQKFSQIEIHELFFRKEPYSNNNFVMVVGIPYALRYLKSKIDSKEKEWLLNQGYSKEFVNHLLSVGSKFFDKVNIWSVHEGTIMCPNEPIMRIEGPTNAVQMLETYFLNQIGYPTLIATKALRCIWASKQFKGEVLLSEYGLRRAHASAGHVGARAACIAGFAMTSDALAGRVFGLQVSGGSMMHADIQRRTTEEEAFKSFYEYVPYKDKIIFLIDTYNVLDGARTAIKVAKEMRKNGHELFGVRIDSGDLKVLIPEVKKLFIESGFPKTKILISGDMNEYRIFDLAKNDVYPDMIGVGTELITGGEKPALGMVYKLKGVIQDDKVIPKIKISADSGKTTIPGPHQVFRIYDKETGKIKKDIIAFADEAIDEGEPLLKQVVSNGIVMENLETSDVELTNRAREYAKKQMSLIPDNVLDFTKPDKIAVELSSKTKNVRDDLINSFQK